MKRFPYYFLGQLKTEVIDDENNIINLTNVVSEIDGRWEDKYFVL
jgi:hypothetical protein